MSVSARCPSYRESSKGSKERHGQTRGVCLIEVSVKRESTVDQNRTGPPCISISKTLKTESIRKLSNFSFQGTKTLYQNNLDNIAFFFTFFKGYTLTSYL